MLRSTLVFRGGLTETRGFSDHLPEQIAFEGHFGSRPESKRTFIAQRRHLTHALF